MDNFVLLNGQCGKVITSEVTEDERLGNIREVFNNIKLFAQKNDSQLSDVVRLVVAVADMRRDRPLINEIQKEMWGVNGPFPCRTIIQVDYLGAHFVEIDTILRIPNKNKFDFQYIRPRHIFNPTGTWSLGIRTDEHVFISGMRGISPNTDALVVGEAPRIRQALMNMKMMVEEGGASISDVVSLVIYVTDEKYLGAFELVQNQFWVDEPIPQITVNIVTGLNDGDIFEIEGTFKLQS